MILDKIFYAVIGWLDFPSKSTSLGQKNLRYMDNGILQCSQYILALSQDKAELSDVNTLVQDVSLDVDTGILTVMLKNGTVHTYDLAIEKVVVNFDITDDNQLVLTLADGTQKTIDLTRFVYSVDSTTTVSMEIKNRTIMANIVDGSITLNKLESSIMETIRQYTLDAQAAEASAKKHNINSKSWAVGKTGTRDGEEIDNSEYYSIKSKEQADRAESYAELSFPEFLLDTSTGHLICHQGKNIIILVNDKHHVIVEVV